MMNYYNHTTSQIETNHTKGKFMQQEDTGAREAITSFYEVDLNDDNDVYDDSEIVKLLTDEDVALLDKFAARVISLSREQPTNKPQIAAWWKYLSSKLYKERYKFLQAKVEVENQKTDLEHQLTSLDSSSNEYIVTLRKIGDTVTHRRQLKDTEEYLNVARILTRKIGNFVLGMDKRLYTPKSKKYRNEETETPAPKTVVKLETQNGRMRSK